MAGETKSQGKKHELDKFYTKTEIVEKCLATLDLKEYDCIIEPSAGDGAFSKKIINCKAFDVEPEDESITKADWFTLDKSQFVGNKILVIGNPPFGQQNTLALRFFNTAAEFANTIAFILPLSFKKDTLKNKLNLNFHLVNEIILEKNSFILEGAAYGVPCVFQIWEKKNIKREVVKFKTTSAVIDFTKNISEADFRIPRVGGNAGKASIDIKGSLESNYFIINKSSLSNIDLVNLINSITFPSIGYTSGPKSLSKGELIYELENILNLGMPS